MSTQNQFDNLFQHITPEFVKENLKKAADKLGVEMNVSDETIEEMLQKFKETLTKTEAMRQDAVAFKDELSNLVTNSRDGNGNFSAEYFYQAVSQLEEKIQKADLADTDRTILEGLVSGAKNIAGFWLDKKDEEK